MKSLDELKRLSGGTNTNGSPLLFHFTYGQLAKLVEIVREDKDKEIAAKQAKIDRLMWEYCPQEMTLEQVANWEAHQQPWSDK